MKIVWDEPKRISNIKKHGFDFAELDFVFFEKATFIPAKYNRNCAIALFKETNTAVIFMPLGKEAISIISMRRASKKELRFLC